MKFNAGDKVRIKEVNSYDNFAALLGRSSNIGGAVGVIVEAVPHHTDTDRYAYQVSVGGQKKPHTYVDTTNFNLFFLPEEVEAVEEAAQE